MSPNPLRRKGALGAPSSEALLARADALRVAVDSGGELLDPAARQRASDVATKVAERTGLVGDHTVVALAGATGSGKSSLFNAIVGSEVAQTGMRRPTTSTPTAAVWGEHPAGDLLDWLQVGTRHVVPPSEVGSLEGLVLIDLPDFDSRESAHRAEARRVLELVDVFVWVTDPQKYADAVLHDDYVAVLQEYGAVTTVVLNQVDRLPADGVQRVKDDLARLLESDGLVATEVVGTSALDGTGLDELRHRLADAVGRADAARHRLGADLSGAAEALAASVGDDESDPDGLPLGALVDALARAAGVPTVVDAVGRDFRRQSLAQTGWPFTRWVRGLRPAPLSRLRLDSAPESAGGEPITEDDLRAVVGRSSIPTAAPAARAAVDLASRRLGDSAARDLPPRWADAVADAVHPHTSHLADRLDQAVLSTRLRGRQPLWWTVFGGLQIFLAAAAVIGALWLVVIALAAWLQLPALPSVDFGPFALPFLLLVGGLVLGVVLAALARWMARIGAKRRAAAADRRLRAAITEVARRELVAPVGEVLERHRRTRKALAAARG